MKMLSRRSTNPTLSVATFFSLLIIIHITGDTPVQQPGADKLLACGRGLGRDISSGKDIWKFDI